MQKVLLSLFFLLNCLNSYSQDDNNYTDYIYLYQSLLSDIRNGECQMSPSCSNYGMTSFKENNPLLAFMMTSDRVLRCSHDFRNYKTILINNNWKLLDLPNNNIGMSFVDLNRNSIVYPVVDSCANNFINALILDKNYREALLDINREIYKGNNCISLYKNYIKCKRALNEIEDILFKYDFSFPSHIKNNHEIKLEIANCFLELGEYEKANSIYNGLLKNNSLADKSNLLIGLSFAHQHKFDSSAHYFSNVSKSSQYYYISTVVLENANQYKFLKYKNKNVAGLLAIIPGLGYVYTGHNTSGISSLIINSLLFYAVYTSINTKNYGVASLMGVFSIGFYLGNISGSIKSAKRYNYKVNDKLLNKIKSNINY